MIWPFEKNYLDRKNACKRERIHEKEIHCVNWNPSNTLVGTASADLSVKLWNLKAELKMTLNGHIEIVYNVLWHPYQPLIFTSGIDNFIIVWNS